MNYYCQITGGRGPIECAAAVTKIAFEFCNSLKNSKILPKIVESEQHHDDSDCFMSLVLLLENCSKEDFSQLQEKWEGTNLYICTKNTYRPNHKRKNWFVGVYFFNDTDLITIQENEIKYEAIRASGPGGQNVNKVSSAIRATYLPLNLSVVVSEEREQPRNKELAKQRLIMQVTKINELKLADQNRKIWSNHTNLERGNPKQTFKGEL